MNLMYKLRLFVAVLFAAVVAVSCEETVTGGDNTAELIDGFTLVTSGSSVTNLSVDVTVDSDQVGNYVVALMLKSAFTDDYESDLTTAAAAASASLVADYNVDFSIVDQAYVFNGDASVNLATAWPLASGTAYIVLVYGVDALGAQTTNVAYKNVSTQYESTISDYTGTIFINEVDPNTDWIELYSIDREAISLDGFYFVNSAGDKTSLDGLSLPALGYVAVDSNVNANGDTVTLYDGDDKLVDDIDVPVIGVASSYGRKTDGSDTWVEFTSPSRGTANGMASYEGEAFTVAEHYNSESAVVFIVTPNQALASYNYAYITLAEEYFNSADYFGGDITAMADWCAAYYQYVGVDAAIADGKFIFNGADVINAANCWLVEKDKKYITAIFALDEDCNRVSEAVKYEATATGSLPEMSDSYSKWIGTWDFTCTASDGKSLTMDVVIEPNIVDWTYHVTGFDVSALRSVFPVTAYLLEGEDETTSEEFSYLAFSNENTLYYFDPEADGQAGRLYSGSLSTVIGEDRLSLVGGSYISIFGVMGEDGESATLEGYLGELTSGAAFQVEYQTALFESYAADEYGSVYSYYNDEAYGGSTSEKYPKSPYTATKTSSSTATSAPARAMSVDGVMPNLYRAAISKALNAPKSEKFIKYFSK